MLSGNDTMLLSLLCFQVIAFLSFNVEAAQETVFVRWMDMARKFTFILRRR